MWTHYTCTTKANSERSLLICLENFFVSALIHGNDWECSLTRYHFMIPNESKKDHQPLKTCLQDPHMTVMYSPGLNLILGEKNLNHVFKNSLIVHEPNSL